METHEGGEGEAIGEGALQVRSAEYLSRCSQPEARCCMSYEVASRLGVLPLAMLSRGGETVLYCLTERPITPDLEREVRFASALPVHLERAGCVDFGVALHRAYFGDGARVKAELSRHAGEAAKGREARPGTAFGRLGLYENQGDAGRMLTLLVEHSVALGASDLHLVPRHDGAVAQVRVDGELLAHEGPICTAAVLKLVVSRVKVLCGIDVSGAHRAHDGSFRAEVGPHEMNVRASILPTIHGEKLVLRFLGGADVPALETLGFAPDALRVIDAFCEKHEGTLVCAGPTGSGKSTTLYSLAVRFAERGLSVVTIEDPVEVQIPKLAQVEVCEKRGLTFAGALRSILRQDPDVILVGELRDTESAVTAFQAALTGHLVLCTTHARTTQEVFLRLRMLGVDSLSLTQGLDVVIAQRLLPKLCGRCKVIDLSASRGAQGRVYQAVGCRECDYSGIAGRALAAEVLEISPEIRERLFDSGGESMNATRVRELAGHRNLAAVIRGLVAQGIVPASELRG